MRDGSVWGSTARRLLGSVPPVVAAVRSDHPLKLPRAATRCPVRAFGREGTGMERSTRVVLAIEAPEVLDEVLHFLDGSDAVRVVATADGERQIVDAGTQLEPDVVIAEPRFAGAVPAPAPCIAIASRESSAPVCAGVGAGAPGVHAGRRGRARP